MNEKIKVEVVIGGKIFTLVGCESEEYIQNVARYIDKKMATVINAESSKALNTHLTAILTSINVADDLFKERKINELLSAEISKKEEEVTRNTVIINKFETELKRLRDENNQLHKNISRMEKEFELTKKELASLKKEFDEYITEFDKKL